MREVMSERRIGRSYVRREERDCWRMKLERTRASEARPARATP